MQGYVKFPLLFHPLPDFSLKIIYFRCADTSPKPGIFVRWLLLFYMMLNRLLLLIPFWLLLDLYFFRLVKSASEGLPPMWKRVVYGIYWGYDGVFIAALLYLKVSGGGIFSGYFFSLVGPMLLSFIPKLCILPILLLWDAGWQISRKVKRRGTSPSPGRRKFINRVILGASAVPFGYVLFGITKGPYHYTVHRHTLYFDDLPPAFDGFTITQLSDIHCGSLKDREAVERGVRLANAQQSDLMVFTGDFVNNEAAELRQWQDVFAALTAPFGVFSILGNHDYGDYKDWPSEEAKAANLEQFKALQRDMGIRLLMDEHVKIEKDSEYINLIGVQNWGSRFRQYGDLDSALEGVEENTFSVLLSHDPSHWEAKVLPHSKPVHLTLSGHTHGMQFGVEIPGIKWSPAQYMYRQWAGMYSRDEQYINVNRGFGFLGFAGRIGIWPEISVITLRRKAQ